MKVKELVRLKELLSQFLVETKTPSREMSDSTLQKRMAFKEALVATEELLKEVQDVRETLSRYTLIP